MSVSRTARFFVATMLLGSTPASLMHAQTPLFELTDLGTFTGGFVPVPTAVNDHGLVAGKAVGPAGGYVPVFMSATQAPTALPLLAGDANGFPCGVNNAGVIVGTSIFANIVHRAVVWTPSPSGYVVTQLPMSTLGVQPTIARALNELGDVVGELSNGKGFAWSANTGTVDLNSFGFSGTARGINESRQIVGGHNRIDLDTKVIEIGTVSGTSIWSFTAIADSGIAVYASTTSWPFGTFSSGGTYEFGVGETLHAFFGSVMGIDYAGNVLFTAQLGSNPPLYITTAALGSVLLSSRIDPPTPLSIVDFMGAAISANGTIAAMGWDQGQQLYRALLLTPKVFHGITDGPLAANGVPILVGEGTLQGGSLATFKVSKAPASTPLALIAGLSRADVPFYGSLLVPTPTLVVTGFTTDTTGDFALPLTWPAGFPSGSRMYLQAWVADPNAPLGVAGTNALECELP